MAAKWVYASVLGWLALALAFPLGLMAYDPVLMFERGWEQYVGTSIYFAALLMLGRELLKLRSDDRAFRLAETWRQGQAAIHDNDEHMLPRRIRQLEIEAAEDRRGPHSRVSMDELLNLNGEASSLDQEESAGRFTLPRYILYLLPVIGFIGTVRGISEALKEIGPALKEVNNLETFLSNLDRVTSALQIAFDSTLLALFLSAALMFVMTLVQRRSEDLLARIDRWIVSRAIPKLVSQTSVDPAELFAKAIRPDLSRLEQALMLQADRTRDAFEALGAGFAPHIERFANSIDRMVPSIDQLAPALERFDQGSERIGQLSDQLRVWTESTARIENLLAQFPKEQAFDVVRTELAKGNAQVENLSKTLVEGFDRASRTTQEQLAHTLVSLKDALDMLQVSIEQGNVLYRSIVKKITSPLVITNLQDEAA